MTGWTSILTRYRTKRRRYRDQVTMIKEMVSETKTDVESMNRKRRDGILGRNGIKAMMMTNNVIEYGQARGHGYAGR